MPFAPGELRKIKDEERRRARAHRQLRWAERRRLGWWLLGGVLLLALIGLVGRFWGLSVG